MNRTSRNKLMKQKTILSLKAMHKTATLKRRCRYKIKHRLHRKQDYYGAIVISSSFATAVALLPI